MTEFKEIHRPKTITYQGYIELSTYWRLVKEQAARMGYDYIETNHNEIVDENGKNIYIYAELDKELSSYAKSRIITTLNVTQANDVAVEIQGVTRRMQEATVELTLQPVLVTDHEGRYQDNLGFIFFVENIIQRVFAVRIIKQYAQTITTDTETLRQEAKNYLNLLKQQ